MAPSTTPLTKQRAITYLNRDFDGLKQDLISHLQIYFPNNYQDFNESTLGVMLVEMAAFIGDNLSFYLDKKFSESFTATAQEPENIFKHARELGFKAFGKTSAYGEVDQTITVPAVTTNSQIMPDMRYAGIVRAGTQVGSQSQVFETLEDANFSSVNTGSSDTCGIAKVDPTSKLPVTYWLTKQGVPVQAGQTKTATFVVGAYQPFLNLTISDNDVLEVLKVTDSLGNQWYEVDYLAQDTVFDGRANIGADATDVPYVMVLRTVPYRFVTEYDFNTNKTSLIFGTGDGSTTDSDLIPNLGDLSIPTLGKTTFTDFTIDPQNFLRTNTLGVAPTNTTLTVSYRVGGGASTNAGAGQINKVTNTIFDVGDTTLSTSSVQDVRNSLAATNPSPAQGGRDNFSPDEIRQLVAANFAAQGRAVTVEDYIARTLSMPSRYGAVFRALAKASTTSQNTIELAVLAKDENGNPCAPSLTLQNNLKSYLNEFRMLTDAVLITAADMINFKFEFSILCSPDYNRSQVLADCLSQLQTYLDFNRFQIGMPLNMTSLHYLLADVDGVLSVYQMTVTNLAGIGDAGRIYSSFTYNISANTANNLVYCPANAMFVLLYPNSDIIGTAK